MTIHRRVVRCVAGLGTLVVAAVLTVSAAAQPAPTRGYTAQNPDDPGQVDLVTATGTMLMTLDGPTCDWVMPNQNVWVLASPDPTIFGIQLDILGTAHPVCRVRITGRESDQVCVQNAAGDCDVYSLQP